MSSPIEKFSEFFGNKYGRSVGEHKLHIVESTSNQIGSFTPEEIAAELSGIVSRATIYRTCHLMVEAGLLRQVKVNDRLGFANVAT